MSRHFTLGLAAAVAALAGMGTVVADPAHDINRKRRRREPTQRELDAEKRAQDRAIARAATEHRKRLAEEAELARPKSRQEQRRLDRKKAKRLRQDRCFQKGEKRP